MMYVGTPPWHGLGTRLDKPATAQQAIAAAGLDWEVATVPRGPKLFRGFMRSAKDHATIRKDPGSSLNGAVLGYVNAEYTPLQNRAAFRFFDPIVGQDAAAYETAGALGRGEKVWMLARLPKETEVAPEDSVRRYLLLSNSHDGSEGVQLRFTPVRVVCGNTLFMALKLSRGLELQHTPDLPAQLKQAAANLHAIENQFTEIETTFKAMARTPVTKRMLSTYFEAVFPARSDDPAADPSRELRESAAGLFLNGRGNDLPGVRGTLWGAYNGVTELVDHYLYREGSPEARLRSVCFGEGYEIKVRAYETALCLLERSSRRPIHPQVLSERFLPARKQPEPACCGV
jgi:phage/plasmid-like protein (TIGR03299 family)